ncbi:sugar ABC transporter ATP-binding protein [Hydrogenophaga sp.]|uniref:sugar ABC transporter ATP-binding protein n=1 Tax=Hydrogenophaga sp. TaxID=1904254 RepID=UPI00286DC49E|nr:sugar ABC transporter ATP-binding protein [Hydrogenophaga sp.]
MNATRPTTERPAPLRVSFKGITKSFGPVQVLHGVDFDLPPGQVLGLLGENGAGKSTLMKILAGFEQAGGGELWVNGRVQTLAHARDAEALGIVLIHQEFSLAEDLSVAQNLFLGHEIRRGWGGLLLDDERMRAQAQQAVAQVGLTLDVDTRVKDLIVAEKQLVEIARALMRQARLLIMDEPTATLTPTEAERLFGLMRQLKSEGVTLVYISHKLDEVERITDEVVVMRDGRCVAQQPTASLSRQQMANLMVGRELADLYPPKTSPPASAAPALRVTGLCVPGWAQDVGFEVAPGEILGFAGLVGAGRTELFEGLLGLRERSAGTVELAGQPRTIRGPRDAVRLGLTYLSEDRKGKGLHVHLGLRENLTLMALERYARPLLQPAQEQQALTHAVQAFGIRTGHLQVKVSSLSGGNQQKLALAKVLHPAPRVVVLDEPTRGVDVGAKRDIYLLIQQLASQGLAVVIISSELMELIGMCHRVAVMRAGRLQTVLDSDHLTEEELIAHATGTH